MSKNVIIVPNWNGLDHLKSCLDSLLNQTEFADIILVENGSTDGSLEFVKHNYPEVVIVRNNKNLGFAGGVNSGISFALKHSYKYLLLINNDAIADRNWVKNMTAAIESDKRIGIVTSKILKNNHLIDNVGNYYSNWGLPFPYGRNDVDRPEYNEEIFVLGASGGACIFRIEMLKKIGLFDEDFFAYYEDMDISFRAIIAGWKIKYQPTAIVYHQIGATSRKLKGFTTYQTMKNLPWLIIKNIPLRYLFFVIFRFSIAYLSFLLFSIKRGHFKFAAKGLVVSTIYMPKKILERFSIQNSKKVDDKYIWSMIVKDLPPDAMRLRKFRTIITLGLVK